MSQNYNQINNDYKRVLINNSSCCGAASDGWVPSYPSISIKTDNTFHIKNQSSSDKSESKSESESLVSINK